MGRAVPSGRVRVSLAGLDQRLADEIAAVSKSRPRRPLTVADLLEMSDAFRQGVRAYAGDDGADEPESGMVARSIVVGHVLLEQPTIAARIVLEAAERWELPAEWADAPMTWLSRFAGFVLSHAHDRESLSLAMIPAQAVALTADFCLGLTCTEAELSKAVNLLTAGAYPVLDTEGEADEDEKKKGSFCRWSRIVLHLCTAMPGTTPDYWMYEATEAQVSWLTRAIRWRNHQERRAAAEAGGKPCAPDSNDPRIVSGVRWKRLLKRLHGG